MRKSSDEEPFSALAFKIMTDPFVGVLTFTRIYSGVLEKGQTVLNSVKGKKERIGRMLEMNANGAAPPPPPPHTPPPDPRKGPRPSRPRPT